jgi:hypothetical protein
MPNWCDNTIKLSHPDTEKMKALAEFIKQEKKETGIFNFLRPIPKDQEENWYEWCVENWGTKWDIADYDSDYWEENNTVTLYGNTAWSPPVSLYEYLVEEGWQIFAMYNEPGVGFCGKFTDEDGDIYYGYDLSDEETLKIIEESDPDLYDWVGLESELEWYRESQEESDES